jgi:hypothetical protein
MRRTLFVALFALIAPALGAQTTAGSIDPGMTKAQVIEHLGAPASERVAGNYTYLFYKNGCERECGMSDLVVLKNDAVVDAVFRAIERTYSGTSSSPMGRHPQPSGNGTLRVAGDSTGKVTGAVTGVEVNAAPSAPAAKPELTEPARPDSAPPRDSTATPPQG